MRIGDFAQEHTAGERSRGSWDSAHLCTGHAPGEDPRKMELAF